MLRSSACSPAKPYLPALLFQFRSLHDQRYCLDKMFKMFSVQKGWRRGLANEGSNLPLAIVGNYIYAFILTAVLKKNAIDTLHL